MVNQVQYKLQSLVGLDRDADLIFASDDLLSIFEYASGQPHGGATGQ